MKTRMLLISLVIGLAGLSVPVRPGQGNNTFRPAQRFPVGIAPQSVAVADLNADGNPDLVVANNTPNTVSVLLQQ
jgi:hypothetical protein